MLAVEPVWRRFVEVGERFFEQGYVNSIRIRHTESILEHAGLDNRCVGES